MLKIKKLDPRAQLPRYMTDQAAGMDLFACLGECQLEIPPGKRVLVPTRLAIRIHEGYEGQIRPRSGLAVKHGVTVLNTPGTIDSDYRGELKVLLINHGDQDFVVTHGMRIAQLVIAPIARQTVVEVDDLGDETERGSGGFGHTG